MCTTLESWVNDVSSIKRICAVGCKVCDELYLCQQIKQLPNSKALKCDIVLENIIFFNRNSLYLRQLKYAIKFDNVGAILDIIKHSMLAYCGTGKTPKYAETLFNLLVCLQIMEPKLW